MQDDIWKEPPRAYYEDGVRFGTGSEMIAEIKRLRSEIEITKRIASIFRERLKSFGGSYMVAVKEVEGILVSAAKPQKDSE